VLSEVNRALVKVLAHPVRARAASRTDAGVHAIGQVIAFRTSAPRTADEIQKGVNSLLPGDIRITECREIDFEFHPRHSAVGKVYLYRLLRAEALPPMSRKYVLFLPDEKPFDLEALEAAATDFEGEHDFRSFSPRLLSGENPEKTMWRVSVVRADPLVELRFLGSGFLYQMARRMTGLLVAIAQGRERVHAVQKALEEPLVGSVPYTAPPRGLFLESVLYSDEEVRATIADLVGS
jgi:tRNA pseudouridine38-40 synthase